MKKMPINLWNDADRPREKLMMKGKNSLSDAELIAILIGSGNVGESAVELSQRILKTYQNSLVELSRLSLKQLTDFKGIGQAKAITILAALELGRRRREADVTEEKIIRSSKDVFELFQPDLADIPHEEFWILLIGRSNRILKKVQISSGGITGSLVDPRMVFKVAIDSYSSGIILCHNHPSGNIKPSNADIEITGKLVRGARLLDMAILDHIIIGTTSFFSFADEGILATL